MTNHEKLIIKASIWNSLVLGTGIHSHAKEQIELYGYTWTDEHEDFLTECLFQKEDDNDRNA